MRLMLAFFLLAATAFGAMAQTGVLATSGVGPPMSIDPTNIVQIPWGAWLAGLLDQAAPIIIAGLVGLLTLLAHRIGGRVGDMLIELLENKQMRQVATHVVDQSIANVEHASRTDVMTIDVTNRTLNEAIRIALEEEPKFAAWAGPKLRAWLYAELARLPSVPDASSAALVGVTPLRAAAAGQPAAGVH